MSGVVGAWRSVLTRGRWNEEVAYPAEEDVKAGVTYAEGVKTGTFTGNLPTIILDPPSPEIILEGA